MNRRVIRVVAPGRPLRTGLDQIASALFERHPIAATHALEFDPQVHLEDGHFAGTDEARSRALEIAFRDDSVDVVWAANGGYGACRILDAAMPVALTSRTKTVAGYSDFGFVLAALFGRSTHHLVHAPMCVDLIRNGGEIAFNRALDAFLEGPPRPGKSAGPPVFVCNLSVLTKLIGTREEPNIAGHLLALEDVSEHYYAIDRMLFQVSDFARRVGLAAVGQAMFTDLQPNDPPWGETLSTMFEHWFGRHGIPVVGGLCFGHSVFNQVQWLGAPLSGSATTKAALHEGE